jgi:hypothetical protein
MCGRTNRSSLRVLFCERCAEICTKRSLLRARFLVIELFGSPYEQQLHLENFEVSKSVRKLLSVCECDVEENMWA